MRITENFENFEIEDGVLKGYHGTAKLVVIPKTVKTIANDAFEDNALIETLVVNEGAETIEYCAFLNCRHLKKAVLPKSLTRIEMYAFSGCISLTDLCLYGDTEVESGAFSHCLLHRVRVEGEYTFESLKEKIEDSNLLVSVGCCLLCDTGHLGKNPQTGNLICSSCGHEYGTSDCKTIQHLQIKNGVVKKYHGSASYLRIPNGVKRIGFRAFDDTCVGEVDIPDTVEIIESEAFLWVDAALGIHLPHTLKRMENKLFCGSHVNYFSYLPRDLEYIGSGALLGVGGMTDIRLPDGVKVIGPGSFAENEELRRIVMNDALVSVGYSAFKDCDVLRSVRFSKALISLGDQAFENCRFLEEVTLNDGLLVIGEACFKGCTGLKHITIPETVRYVGKDAFRDCKNLRTVKLPASLFMMNRAAVFDIGVQVSTL